MEERKKVKVAIQQHNKQSEKNPYEKVLTPKSKKKNISKLSLWTVLKSAFLALIVGAVFGIGMLIFLDISNPATTQSQDDPTPVTADDEDSTENNSDGESIQYSGGSYEVFQLGVFSTEENASAFQTSLNNIPSVVVPNEDQFYLLTGILHESVDESVIESHLQSKGLDKNDGYYLTSWSFEEKTVSTNEDNETWLDAGRSLLDVSDLNGEWEEELTSWLGNYPQSMEDHQYINELINLTTREADGDSDALLNRATMYLTLNLLFESI
ncbi:hypothetical protein [Alkalibacillus almallahensis]|uniref:hypothetical protein n=1 Tax=Alkalibacillus almallahensis TaxID=1379154 RepID=UPI00141F765B|nr:hypothetical protein [Alkalibacillus almallahensis]NIK11236.1 hypothetical protein [Alkalibacillus almallahensis]